jgi:hypothetical protein
MKRFFLFAQTFILASVFHSFAFAQDNDWGFQFRYKTEGKLYSFEPTGFFNEPDQLPKDVYRSFFGGQKSPDRLTYWGNSIYHSDSGDQLYYVIYEMDTVTQQPTVQHLYDDDGLWLYSVIDGTDLDSVTIRKLDTLIANYALIDGPYQFSTYIIRKNANIDYYIIDLHEGVFPKYLPEPGEQGEYEDVALRIVFDQQFNEVQRYELFGNSTELRELHLMSPMFLK